MRLRLAVSTSAPTAQASAALAAGKTAIEVTPALTMLDGPMPGQVFRIAPAGKRTCVAGRSVDADIPIPDATVSRKHARFWIEPGREGDRAMVEDLRSTNGTFINGQRTERSGLHRGDRVILGSVVLRFDLLDPVEVQVAEQIESTVRSAALDPLTGLQTRRSVGELDAPVPQPLSAVLIDLDHFKSVNDTFGHGAGDAVLKLAAQALARSLRAGDLAVRWGGEEFLALLPSADLAAAQTIAQRVLEAIRAQDVRLITPDRQLSASLGVAQARAGETLASAIERADQALYVAKRSGRGRVEVAS